MQLVLLFGVLTFYQLFLHVHNIHVVLESEFGCFYRIDQIKFSLKGYLSFMKVRGGINCILLVYRLNVVCYPVFSLYAAY